MWNMIWPMALVVVSNSLYHFVAKETPTGTNAFLSLTVTYLVAAAASAALFLAGGQAALLPELKKLNWTTLVMGVAIIGLELGYICLYRAGWKVSLGSLVANILLACVLLAVGVLLYKEAVTLRQMVGMAVCAVGMFLVCK
ncbi:MAG: hypothetical protein IKU72_04260 [Oscillospiraceae bacterium]|nr:hypothetical protein [Oscillospiraceae bacterium]